MRDRQYEVLAGFRYALRRFLHFSEAAAATAGLSPAHHQALLAIKGSGADTPTIGYLAERLQIRHHSAVGLVDRLCALGFLVRRTPARDRRQVVLSLTRRGVGVLRRLSREHQRELSEIEPQLRALLGMLPGTKGRGRKKPDRL